VGDCGGEILYGCMIKMLISIYAEKEEREGKTG
jgi:hypothetical protein